MFYPLEYGDRMLVIRGVVILVVVILLGVLVTQHQLNTLTQREECIVAVDIPRDQQGIYSFYLFGATYDVQGVYPVGQIINKEQSIVLKSMGYMIEVPTYIEINCKKELERLDLWAKLLVKKIFQFKRVAGVYMLMMHERINVYISQFR